MPVTILSSTDKPEQVQAALGDAKVKAEANDPPAEKTAGKSEGSDPSKESAKTDEKSEVDETQVKKETKKNGFKKRIDKLSRRATDAEMRADYWKNQFEASQKGAPAESKETKPSQAVDLSSEPNPDNFEKHSEYLKAMTKWTLAQERAAEKSNSIVENVKTEQKQLADKYTTDLKEFKKSHDDFQDVVEIYSEVKMTPFLETLILKSGPEFAYELGKDKDELERICALSPQEAAEAIGFFKGKLKSQAKAAADSNGKDSKETKESKTKPAPIQPVGSKNTAVKSIYSEDVSFQEYKKLREADSRR